uniref:ATP synthase CF0 subunit I n=1 Tax=Phelipanche purpurea TaxID=223125 RepID=V6AQD6_PHEPU|nr:ATP synthase CF0 subunit I [Phelipanche purpurea]CDH98319.1 ATP synthase CF0 subunit I [Phelipanche purpurea]
MKNLTYFLISFGHRLSSSFRFNTDILVTNPINISVVISVLIFFVWGVLSDLLDNRKDRIFNTIRNLENLRIEAIEELEKAKACLREVEADKFLVNGYSEIKREKLNLVNLTYNTLKKLENCKNETIKFKRQRAINQVRQLIFQQALQGALGTFNSCLPPNYIYVPLV